MSLTALLPAADTGLVLGKFLPPHRGHQFLLDFARQYVRRLFVLVCSLQCEPIPGELRQRWVRELCPGAAIIHLADELPSYPKEHPDFWTLWTAAIRKRLPTGPDLVFTSEDYGDELARRLGARHIMVDKARELVPVSGTALRSDPLRYWEYLPECVRPYFLQRVAVIGPESTGKTTLCRQLAAHFRTVWVNEYARGYLDHKGAFCTAEDFPALARGQLAQEEALARQANRVLFCDTDLRMTVLYSELYCGFCPEEIRLAAQERRYDLYLVTDCDVPWVADWQRDQPQQRREILEWLLTDLRQGGQPHSLVSGLWEARFQLACAAVAGLLSPQEEA